MNSLLIAFLLLPSLAFAQDPPPLVPVREGSGLVINAEGDVLTNAHVVEGCVHIIVTLGGVPSPASLRAHDAKHDLALLRTSLKPATHAPFASAGHRLRVGEPLRILGFPGETTGAHRAPTATPATLTRLTGPMDELHWITLSSHAAPGNSGGPVLNTAGQVVAVMNGGITATPTNEKGQDAGPPRHLADVAIPAKTVRAFLHAHRLPLPPSAQPTALPRPAAYTVTVHCREQ